jgi:hypothetical protein
MDDPPYSYANRARPSEVYLNRRGKRPTDWLHALQREIAGLQRHFIR